MSAHLPACLYLDIYIYNIYIYIYEGWYGFQGGVRFISHLILYNFHNIKGYCGFTHDSRTGLECIHKFILHKGLCRAASQDTI